MESKLPKIIADTTSAHPVHIVPVVNYATKHDDTVPVDNTESAGYTAYIKSNATGVVYMRMLDNYRSDVVSVIPGNSKVTVLEKGNGFYKIMFNSKTGYVPKWTVKKN